MERFRTGRGNPGEVQDGWGTFGEFRDGSLNPRGGPGRVWDPMEGPGWVGRHAGRAGTSQGTLLEVQNSLFDAQGGPKPVGEPAGRSGTVSWNLVEVLDG